MSSVSPGIHTSFDFSDFSEEERKIIERMSKDWYVTRSGSEIPLGASRYRYILLKPTDMFQQMFNLDREIVAVFSSYDQFEPRTLDAFSAAMSNHQKLRIERICSVLISRDEGVESKLRELLRNDQEAQVVVPFTYSELSIPISDPYFFRNRFISHFYARDLFASETPLKKDLYFFGRNSLVQTYVNRHLSGQVSGLFGLRKTGKTSIIFGVQRALSKVDGASAYIDCQSPAFHKKRWNHALHLVLQLIKQEHGLSERLGQLSDYSETDAPIEFEKHLIRMSGELGNRSIMLIFDEVENITPGVSPSDHWRSGEDFVYFWQTLRSLFQRRSELFSYLLVGTNPLCVEMARVGGADNPIFAQVPIEYVPGFGVSDTRDMVRKLGRTMGLEFDEILYGFLTDDFGGHPYLIRHVCSVINRLCQTARPVKVDKTLYVNAVDRFGKEYSSHVEMILGVLKTSFPDEFDMLRFLARGDTDDFYGFVRSSPSLTNHLVGYGVLGEVDGRYSFKIESIKRYLSSLDRYKKAKTSPEEMRSEVSQRRNALEKALRKICRMQLQSTLGAKGARDVVESILGPKEAAKRAQLSYADIFDGNKNTIMFSDLTKIIRKSWDSFEHVLGPSKEACLDNLERINEFRIDAHSKEISDAEFQLFRVCMERLEKATKAFLEG